MKVLVILVSAFSGVVFLEGMMQILDVPPYPDQPLNIYERDNEIGFRFNPNSKGIRSDWEYQSVYNINKLGLRDDNSLSKNSNVDLFLIGDSQVEGQGLSHKQTISSVLKEISDLKVVNLGLGSTGTFQHVKIFQRYVEIFRNSPRIALLVFTTHNDFYDNTRFHDTILATGKPHQTVQEGYLVENDGTQIIKEGSWIKRYDRRGKMLSRRKIMSYRIAPSWPIQWASWSKLNAKVSSFFFKNSSNCNLTISIDGLLDSHTDFETTHQWKVTKKALLQFVNFAKSKKIIPIVAILPSKYEMNTFLLREAGCNLSNYNGGTSTKILKKFLNLNRVLAIDLAKRLNSRNKDSQKIFYKFDDHLTPYGSRVVSEFILERLIFKDLYNASY